VVDASINQARRAAILPLTPSALSLSTENGRCIEQGLLKTDL
jgi:hypothetical protein